MEIVDQKKYLIDSFLSLIRSYSIIEQKEIIEKLSFEFNEKNISPTNISLPTAIFRRELGALESICKFLRENLLLSSQQISRLLGRSVSTIDISYAKAKKKLTSKFVLKESVYSIPLSIFSYTKIGVQEAIVGYLRDNYGIGFNQIAVMLERNYQTVRTAYIKYLEKNGDQI